ncbi:MAG: hypothetical protein KBB15_03790 [Firmicutes bacterium]|nr:hypothetical protein [Bacillota bacterium]
MTTRCCSVLSLLVVMSILLPGCFAPPPFSEPVERVRITNALDAWVAGVEHYDIDAMSGNAVLAPHFILIMSEAGHTYTKDVGRLRAELEADRARQEALRKLQGYEIRLDMDGALGIPGDLAHTCDSVNAWEIRLSSINRASVAGFFEAFEKSIFAPLCRFDSGSICIEFTKTGAGWRMSEMHIRFGPSFYGLAPTSDAATSTGPADESALPGPRGAGFGMGMSSIESWILHQSD